MVQFDAGHVHDDGRLVDELGLELRLRADHRVHDVGPLLFERDAQGGDLGLGLFLLPLQGVDPLVVLDPHLVQGGGVAVGRVLDVERGDAQQMADAPDHQHQVGHVDAERAVHGAALAEVALGGGDDARLLDEVGADLAVLAQHFPQRLLDLAHRRIARVAVVGEKVVAGVGAQAAVHAGVDVGLEARTGFGRDHPLDDLLDFLLGQVGHPALQPLVDHLVLRLACLSAMFVILIWCFI